MNAEGAKKYAEKRLTEFVSDGKVQQLGMVQIVNLIIQELGQQHNFAVTIPSQQGLLRVRGVQVDPDGLVKYIC